MTDLLAGSAKEIAKAIRNKEVSAVEVVRCHLTRIAAVNSKLNAVVQLAHDAALAEAAAADKLLATGEVRGPLHGVPMTIKDALDTAGMITTAGTLGRRQVVPEQDATVVARLKQAGAILLGKTNTPELTLAFETDNLVYGRTNNPYSLARTPGGSSGGSAAIVAAGGAPFDIGSDTFGSIRQPAHCCGIVGLRPTAGRVSRSGLFPPPGGPLDSITQVGPLTRWVEDQIILLQIIAGEDWRDPTAIPGPLLDPVAVPLGRLRIAYHTHNAVMPVAGAVAAAVRASAEALDGATLQVDEAHPPGLDRAYELVQLLGQSGGRDGLARWLSVAGTHRPSPFVQRLLDNAGRPLSMAKYALLLEEAYALRAAALSFLRAYDAILCPVAAEPAAPHGTAFSDDSRFSYTMSYSLLGWPAVVVRAGTSPEGLPIGVQILARPWREDVALAIAQYLELVLGGWQAPPDL